MTAIALTAITPALYDGSTDAQFHMVGIRASTDAMDALSRSDGKDHAGTHALPASRQTQRAHQQAPPRVHLGPPAFYSAACADAYQGVRWYRARYDTHRAVMGSSLAPPVEQAMNCRRLRERARYWQHAAKVNRIAATHWARTLHNHKDWPGAVREVQKAFPGTASWLLSCSAAESRHGAWVRYGGSPYYPGYEYTNEVGGFLQYRWRTFQGHYRHGLDSLRSRGFRVSLPEPRDVRAWLSPLGQAVAGGWARWSGNDDSHWSASWGRGC